MAEVNIAYNKNDFLFNLYNDVHTLDPNDYNEDTKPPRLKNKNKGEELIKAKNNYNVLTKDIII